MEIQSLREFVKSSRVMLGSHVRTSLAEFYPQVKLFILRFYLLKHDSLNVVCFSIRAKEKKLLSETNLCNALD